MGCGGTRDSHRLRDAIMSIWTKIQHLVESVPRRIKAVLKTKGGPTRYYKDVPNKVASECILIIIYLIFVFFLIVYFIYIIFIIS